MVQVSRRSGRQVQRQLSRFQVEAEHQQPMSDGSQVAAAEDRQGSVQDSMLAAWDTSLATLAEHVSLVSCIVLRHHVWEFLSQS